MNEELAKLKEENAKLAVLLAYHDNVDDDYINDYGDDDGYCDGDYGDGDDDYGDCDGDYDGDGDYGDGDLAVLCA